MKLPPEEPAFGDWRVVPASSLIDSWRDKLPSSGARPGVVAVDGRGASGKSTVATVLSNAVAGSVVVHTDDLAWHQAFFDWADLAREGVLEPTHEGREVRFRPPAWGPKGREGSIDVPAGTPFLILEGSGSAREALLPWIDVVVWVQADVERARERGLERDGGTPEVAAFWDEWTREELPFFAGERPWERTDVIVFGTPDFEYDPASQLVVTRRS